MSTVLEYGPGVWSWSNYGLSFSLKFPKPPPKSNTDGAALGGRLTCSSLVGGVLVGVSGIFLLLMYYYYTP